jgi:hypothetical protein
MNHKNSLHKRVNKHGLPKLLKRSGATMEYARRANLANHDVVPDVQQASEPRVGQLVELPHPPGLGHERKVGVLNRPRGSGGRVPIRAPVANDAFKIHRSNAGARLERLIR